jgi:hypothetical protein
MSKSIRPLFWIPTALGTLTGVLALITPVFPDWIEFISGWDPDQHDGTAESWIVIGLIGLTVVLFGFAIAEWRRKPALT